MIIEETHEKTFRTGIPPIDASISISVNLMDLDDHPINLRVDADEYTVAQAKQIQKALASAIAEAEKNEHTWITRDNVLEAEKCQ